MSSSKETRPDQQPTNALKKPAVDSETASTEKMIDGAGMQIALPREHRMIPRPGQVPKVSLAQQLAEYNQVPKAYPIAFDLSSIGPIAD